MSQEPTLFNTTIFNNIANGCAGMYFVPYALSIAELKRFKTKQYPMPTFPQIADVTLEDVIAAATAANAHGFISKLPNG